MICARADLFAAAASVIINLTDESAAACHPSRPVPMLMMNGTADPLIPYQGGRGTSRFAVDGFWSTEKTLEFWRRANGCETRTPPSTDLDDRDKTRPEHGDADRLDVARRGATSCSTASTTAATACPAASPMRAFRAWSNCLLGPQNHDIDGAETIWAFFKKFP